MNKLDYLKSVLACPNCHAKLIFKDFFSQCNTCGLKYKIKKNKFYFRKPLIKSSDSFDSLKFSLKKNLSFLYYKIGVNIIAPSFPFNFLSEIKKLINLENKFVVDLGGGALKLHKNIISIDIYDYDSVDIICDVSKLPFKNSSLDFIVSRSLLEHVATPSEVVAEIYRCLKKRGLTAHLIPFMMPFHASPFDYTRFTHNGARLLFSKFKLIHQFSPFGPFTLLLQFSVEVLSSFFSIPNNKLKPYFYIFLCVLFFPIKYLDFFFVRKKFFISCAPSIFSVFKKISK